MLLGRDSIVRRCSERHGSKTLEREHRFFCSPGDLIGARAPGLPGPAAVEVPFASAQAHWRSSSNPKGRFVFDVSGQLGRSLDRRPVILWAWLDEDAVERMGSAVGQDKAEGTAGASKPAPASATARVTDGRREAGSDMCLAVPTRTYDHMAKVAQDARDLLDALHANVEGLRSGFGRQSPPATLAQGLRDVETCCERLNNILEDALVGVRREGLTLQRASLSLASVLAAALKQVRTSAEAKRVSFVVATELDVAARLDRTLLTRALVKLMDRMIREGEAGGNIAVYFRLEGGHVSISFFRKGANPGVSPSPVAPTWALEPSREGKVRVDTDSELEFCHLVAECHGGSLTVGTSGDRMGALYRIDLPWVV